MTLNCELFQSAFSVLSDRLIKNMFPLHICRQMIMQQRLAFCFKFSFPIFLLMFFPLFSEVVSKMLKIYELPKIYDT